MVPVSEDALRMARPLRLTPGCDVRRSLESLCRNGFVVAGIGSLAGARLRFAGRPEVTDLAGDVEILGLQGSLSEDGAHLHAVVSAQDGRVFGGHITYGNTVRTTVELLIIEVTGWRMARGPDPVTGYEELVLEERRPDA